MKQTVKVEWPQGRYRLLQKAYMPPRPGAFEAVLEEGQEVVYTGKPGDHMEPLDDGARKAMAMRAAAKRGQEKVPDAEVVEHAATAEYSRPAAATNRQSDPDPDSVEIPQDWATRSWQYRKALAAKLTSDPIVSADDAAQAIEAEIARRMAQDDVEI
jgi:hypothetical protein